MQPKLTSQDDTIQLKIQPGFLSFWFGKHHCKAAQVDLIRSRTDGEVRRRRGLRVSRLARGLENRGAEDAELWTHRAGHGAPEPPHPPGRGGAGQSGEKTRFCSTALSKGNKFQEEKWKINIKINHQVQRSVWAGKAFLRVTPESSQKRGFDYVSLWNSC